MSLKNGSRPKLNQPNWRTFSDFCLSWLWNGAYSQNFKFPSSDSWPPKNLGLDASWMKQIGEGQPLLVPKHHFRYSTCYRMNQTSLFWYSESPWRTGPSASQTIPIRGGQISHEQIYTNILPFIAALGKVPTWDHQIWNLLNGLMLLIFFSLFWAKSYMWCKTPHIFYREITISLYGNSHAMISC